MIEMSNQDFQKVKRLLCSFWGTPSCGLRETEERRQALLLVRKWEKKEKRRRAASNSKDI